VTLLLYFLVPSSCYHPAPQILECVTASTGVPVPILDLQSRGWILAERALRSKGKFWGGATGSHRRFTTFPQGSNHHKTNQL